MESLFFWISKLGWLLLSPDSLLLLLALASWLLALRGNFRLARRVLGVVALSMLVIGLFPVDEWLFQPLETRFESNPRLPARIDGIIVLGGAENLIRSAKWRQPEFDDAAERDMAFIALARSYPQAKLVFTGGSGSMMEQGLREADVARELFAAQGLDPARIAFERNSRNTYENALYSKRLLNPGPSENWILITSSWHMPRSVGIFCHAGWKVIPYPVDHRGLSASVLKIDLDLARHLAGVDAAAREWLGLVAYYASGKTDALLPQGCNM